ncbi:MAG: hypothetical protein ABL962_04405 [Fimbriimonadaceae bacterium]
MHIDAQVQIPLFPVFEITTLAEVPDVVEIMWDLYEKRTGNPGLPLLMFEPIEEPLSHDDVPELSEAPEEMLIIAIGHEYKKLVLDALERVAPREPKLTLSIGKKQIKFDENTTLRSFYQQMASLPVTAFTILFPDNVRGAMNMFLLRTPFTVSEVRRELSKPIV